MDFIADEEIKVPVEALLDVIRHRKPTKPGIVCLPQRRITRRAPVLPFCQGFQIHRYSVPVHYSFPAVRADRNILAQIESRPPCVRELRASLAHDVIAQAVMMFLWIYGLHISKTRENGRLSAGDGLCYLSCPLARQMARTHHQHSRRMPVFHDVWNCGSDKSLSNTHLPDAHHAILSPQRLNRSLDGIGLSLERRAQKLIHPRMPLITWLKEGFGLGLDLVSQSPAESLKITRHIVNGLQHKLLLVC